jgi:hypothetical protein
MDPIVDLVCEYEAQSRWQAGERPSFSSDLADNITCGYGELDAYGNWQFPLFPGAYYLEELRQRVNNLRS